MADVAGEFEVGPYEDARDTAELSLAQALAFSTPAERIPGWWDCASRRDLRVVRRGGATLGGLLVLPLGQYFGGRRLEMAGIAGVAIAPEHRGQGAARALMEATLRELRMRGYVHSTLFATTYPLYRNLGYEVAGSSAWLSVPLAQVQGMDRSLTLRPASDADRPALRELYTEQARLRSGFLDRSEYIWGRLSRPSGDPTRTYVVADEDGLEGYATAVERKLSREHQRLALLDFCARTRRGAERLLAFAADHGSLVRDLLCPVAPGDPLLLLVRDTGYELRTHDHWMVRLLDVATALGERGYARGLQARLELEVEDALLSENAGRYVLEVADGRGRVTRGGSGRVRLDVGALASLWSGFVTAEHLALVDRAAGAPEDLAAATAAFSGAAPACPDHF